MNTKWKVWVVTGLLFWTTQAIAGPEKQEVRFEFSNARKGGFILCALFSSAKTFLGKKAVARTRSVLINGRPVCIFRKVRAGTYGMGCFHDKNGNQKLDTGWFGIPKEGYAASNNASGSFGPPSWKKARFVYKKGSFTQKIRLKY
jgi:uncharacterized protein (DUF2141 family)